MWRVARSGFQKIKRGDPYSAENRRFGIGISFAKLVDMQFPCRTRCRLRSLRYALTVVACVLANQGCSGSISATGGDISADPPGANGGESGSIPTPALRRLSTDEYARTLRDTLQLVELPTLAASSEARGAHGFSATALISESDLRAYTQTTIELSEDYVSTHTPCQAEAEPAACAEAAMVDIASRAYRRPLSQAERDRLVALYTAQRQTGSLEVDDALTVTIARILQSPQALYLNWPVPTGETEEMRLRAAFARASRLAYALWRTMPDAVLFEAARSGQLDTREGVEAQARRMLADDKAAAALEAFADDWLHLDLLDGISPNTQQYPNPAENLSADLRREMQIYLAHVVLQDDGRFETLLTSTYTFANSPIAWLYGKSVENDWERIELDPAERSGLLTRVGFMAATGDSTWGNVIKRGILLNEQFLCHHLPEPSDTLDLTQPPDPDVLTNTPRDRFPQDKMSECVDCHQTINPAGFGFDNYDSLGAFRTVWNDEAESAIDVRGSMFLDGAVTAFSSPQEMSQRIADSDAAKRCFAKHMFRYVHHRLEASDDELAGVSEAFLAAGGNIRELIISLVTSDSFLYKGNLSP